MQIHTKLISKCITEPNPASLHTIFGLLRSTESETITTAKVPERGLKLIINKGTTYTFLSLLWGRVKS